jgi:hypothetical protein
MAGHAVLLNPFATGGDVSYLHFSGNIIEILGEGHHMLHFSMFLYGIKAEVMLFPMICGLRRGNING